MDAIMLSIYVGEQSCGKTQFANRLFSSAIFTNDYEADIQANIQIRVRQRNVVEDDIRATIRLIDAPQVGYSLSKVIG